MTEGEITVPDATGRAPAYDLPQLAVACPTCGAQPGDLCTSHDGTRPRRHDTHRPRTDAYAATKTTEENPSA